MHSKKLKSIEELINAIAAMHNVIRAVGEEVILTCQYPPLTVRFFGYLYNPLLIRLVLTSFT